MDSNDHSGIDVFIEESRDHLAKMEADLLTIEEANGSGVDELTDNVFRAIHTIKGSSGFFGLTTINTLTHSMENILGALRAGSLQPHKEILSVLLECTDTLKMLINHSANSNNIPIDHHLNKLRCIECQPASSPKYTAAIIQKTDFSAPVVNGRSPVFDLPLTVNRSVLDKQLSSSSNRFVYIIELDTTRDTIAQLKSTEALLGEIATLTDIISHSQQPLTRSPNEQLHAVLCVTSLVTSVLAELLQLPQERIHRVTANSIGTQTFSSSTTPMFAPLQTNNTNNTNNAASILPQTVTTAEVKTSPPPPQKPKKITAHHNKSLRVTIATIDKLMTLAGEMVLTRNELLQNINSRSIPQIQATGQKVDAITSELQETIMSTRMLSVGIVLSRFRRFARDIALQQGKQLALDIRGEEVELDKSIIEAIGDPLTHIVRNAIGHGIELPDVRIAAGKKPYGTLQITASQQSGHVLLKISDDGCGINPAIIRAKALSSGISDETTLAAMTNDDLIKLVFRPGFSTAESVTELSGRGVGMDVVQNNLKELGGSIDICSITGCGTTLQIKLPLTLAIIPALLVKVEDEHFAIPQGVIEELVRIPAADIKNRLESLDDAAVLRLRGELLPLIGLSELLGIPKTYINQATGIIYTDRRKNISDRRTIRPDSPEKKNKNRSRSDRRYSHTSALNIAVVAAGDFRYGIISDHLLDSLEIVVKPLGTHFSECRDYMGATILGNGHVALILDIVSIRRHFEQKCITGITTRNQLQKAAQHLSTDIQSFLVIENGENEFFAIPIGLISRIERIATTALSSTGGKQVMHYHGTTLRLLSLEDIVGVKPRLQKSHAYSIIMQTTGHEVGILASDIVDTVVIDNSNVDCITYIRPGIIGSTFIHEKLTLIIDLFGMVRQGAPELLPLSGVATETHMRTRILIVEDSAFFRYQICSFIEDAGFETVCHENGADALLFLKSKELPVDLVVTDIEMPKMNGLELTRAIRADAQLRLLPIVAVTSATGKAAKQEGIDAGVDAYIAKFEREIVLKNCIHLIHQKHHKELL